MEARLVFCVVALFGLAGASVEIAPGPKLRSMDEVLKKVEHSTVMTSLLKVSEKIEPAQKAATNGAFWAVVFYAPLVLLAAMIYKNHLKKDTEPLPKKADLEAASEFKEGEWSSGLFECWKGRTDDIFICCCALQFPFIRWADTVNMANMINFWGALGIILALYALSALITGKASGEYGAPASGFVWLVIVCMCVYFRGRMRKKFGMKADGETMMTDCLAWCFCTPCVIAQEARQIETALASGWVERVVEEVVEVKEDGWVMPAPAQAVLPIVKGKKTKVLLKVVSAKGLPVGDMFTSDPYCVCEYTPKSGMMRKEIQTHVMQRTLDPVWNFEHAMEIGEGDVFNFKIYDKNRVLQDEELCGAPLEIIRIVTHFDRELTLQGGPRLRATLRIKYDVLDK